MPSGFTASLPDDVIYDVGVLTVDVADTPTVVGVTRGGLAVEDNSEYRWLEFDGKRSKIEGTARVIKWDIHIKGKFLQPSAENVGRFIYGSSSAEATGVTTITPPAASTLIPASASLENVTLTYGRRNGGYVKIIFPKGVNQKGLNLNSTDNSEGELDVDIEAILGATAAATSTDTAPYKVEVK